MPILQPDRYPDVRWTLDPTLSDDAIPDDLIASDLYLGEAERWVVGIDPLAAGRTGDLALAVQRAIIYKLAAMLSPRFPQPRQINLSGHTGTFQYGETPEQRTSRLESEAFATLVSYLPSLSEIDTSDSLTFVVTVSGRRG